MTWKLHQGDCLEILRGLPPDSVDLCFFSPPYVDCRTYGIGFRLKGQEWVDWMVQVFTECQRVCMGLVACVCEGKTENYRWSPTPALLLSDLHRAGFNLRKPPIFHRVGIPGSGGPDWLRNDWEWIVCTTRPGKLPWSDNTACGHPPKWAPGGEMSYRLSDGTRKNQWGGGEKSGSHRRKNGVTQDCGRPSHIITTKKMRHTKTRKESVEIQQYAPPVLANPGNVLSIPVGGGNMGGDKFASQNEACFPERLAEFFILSFCRPGGIVLDPFLGSGTTLAVAHRHGRNGIGIDIRASQVELSRRRLENETPLLWSSNIWRGSGTSRGSG